MVRRTHSGGYVVKDADGQSVAYVYVRETRPDADTANFPLMPRSMPRHGSLTPAKQRGAPVWKPAPLWACIMRSAGRWGALMRYASE